MKDLFSKQPTGGFSIIEVVLAMALVLIVVSGALSADYLSSYWALSSQLSSEALSLGTEQEGILRAAAAQAFYTVTSTPLQPVRGPGNPLLASCAGGGLCYWTQTAVTDISTCVKTLTSSVYWKVGERYATSGVSRTTRVTNKGELVNRGSDCALESLPEGWGVAAPLRQATLTTAPTLVTGLDVLGERIYVVASSAPQLRIYSRPLSAASVPPLMSSSTVLGNRLNAIDVIRDTASGRQYAFVVQHTKTEQLVVLDVTGDVVTVVTTRSLLGTDPAGSFPQGWRVVAYGQRLYVTTRETAGAELHIFNIANPTNPLEISTGASNLARTVNDMTVREEWVGGVVHRYLFLAASAALKEFAVVEVTGDTPVERVALDLPGTENVLSTFVNGDTVYLGRQQTASGPELYQYQLSALLAGVTVPLARSEVGADVHTLRGSGLVLLLGTSKSTAEVQTWRAAPAQWNPVVANAARIGAAPAPRLAPQGLDSGGVFLYTTTQSSTQPEQLSIWSTP